MLFVLVELLPLNAWPTVADAPTEVEFVPDAEVLFVPVLPDVDVDVELVPAVELPVVEVDVELLFMPEVDPGMVLVVVLPELLPAELLVSAPPGRMVTEPRLVLPVEFVDPPVVLGVLFEVLLDAVLELVLGVGLVVLVPAEPEVVAFVAPLEVTLKGADAALPDMSVASMSMLPADVVDGIVTVVVKLPEPVAVTLAARAVCPPIKMATCWPASKPLPLTVTWLPALPEVGDSVSVLDGGCTTGLPVVDVVPDVVLEVAPEVAPVTAKVASILTVKVSVPCIAWSTFRPVTVMPVVSIVTLAVAPPSGVRFTVVWKLPLLAVPPVVLAVDCWLLVVA